MLRQYKLPVLGLCIQTAALAIPNRYLNLKLARNCRITGALLHDQSGLQLLPLSRSAAHEGGHSLESLQGSDLLRFLVASVLGYGPKPLQLAAALIPVIFGHCFRTTGDLLYSQG